jgi:cytoskeletal protein RodZ
MQAELMELGDILKRRREERNLSLKEVENATSIRLSYLDSIEQGHLGKLISPVYAQGFIKKYAAYLEMDGDQLISRYPTVQRILTEKRADQDNLSFLSEIEIRGSHGSDVKWLPNLIWIGGSALCLLAVWSLAKYLGLF